MRKNLGLKIMKHEKSKKSKTADRKRSDKKKKNSARKKAKRNNGGKSRSKKRHTGKSKYAGKNKRKHVQRTGKLSAKERQIYGAFEALLKADEKKSRKKLKIHKKRGDNLFIIPLKQKGFQNKIVALRNADFSGIDKFLKRQKIEPLYAFVTLKIKHPEDGRNYFNGVKSPASMVVNTENTRDFAVSVLTEYNNDMVDLIQEQYDESVRVYNVVEMSIRFLFMI